MRGFGNLNRMDDLKSQTKPIEEKDLEKIQYSEEQKTQLENVVVPVLENGVYEAGNERSNGAVGQDDMRTFFKG